MIAGFVTKVPIMIDFVSSSDVIDGFVVRRQMMINCFNMNNSVHIISAVMEKNGSVIPAIVI